VTFVTTGCDGLSARRSMPALQCSSSAATQYQRSWESRFPGWAAGLDGVSGPLFNLLHAGGARKPDLCLLPCYLIRGEWAGWVRRIPTSGLTVEGEYTFR